MSWPNTKYCLPHSIVQNLDQRARRAEKKGDAVTAFMHNLGAKILGSNEVQSAIDTAMLDVANVTKRARQNPYDEMRRIRERFGQATPRIPSCFEILGLDPARATKDDVERVRKHLARFYHNDTASSAVDSSQMAKINAAADEAIAYIAARA